MENQLVVNYEVPQELEEVLLEFLDHLYLQTNETSDAGGKLGAAVAHYHNKYVAFRQTGLLPRAARRLKGRSKQRPAPSPKKHATNNVRHYYGNMGLAGPSGRPPAPYPRRG